MYTFPPLVIGAISTGVFHPCGVMYVYFIVLCTSYPIYYSLCPPFTLSISYCIFSIIYWVSLLSFDYPSVFLMRSSKNFSM